MPDGETRYLVDTSILIPMLNRADPASRRRIRDKVVFLSVITLGELYYGARESSRIGRNIAYVNAMVAGFEVLKCTKGTAHHYAVIKDRLRITARPIPENDIWIAATAIQHGLTLITRDSDFAAVAGLLLEQW